jgi:hypothetical protein
MPRDFQPGDFLIFQLESGYGLLRLLATDDHDGDRVWHLAAYDDLFLDVDAIEMALENPEKLNLTHPHLALTSRAFESTQVARIQNVPLTESERNRANGGEEVSDRSIRLLLGLR